MHSSTTNRPDSRLVTVAVAMALLLSASVAAVPVGAQVAADDTTSVTDIQRDSADGSPYAGETVTTEGTVTAVNDDGFFVQDGAGPYSGVYVYGHTTVDPGDVVSVTGLVDEYYGLTEIDVTNGSVATTGTASVPEPTTVDAGNVSREAYEGVLVEVPNATVTSTPGEYGEWSVGDETGRANVDDVTTGEQTTPAETGGSVESLVGPVFYSFDEFKLQPKRIENYSPADPDDGTGSPADESRLTVLSYNDLQTAASDPTATGRLVGAVDARRAAIDGPTVVVGGGDQVSPSSLSPVSNWTVPIQSLNDLEPAADVVGNHDLDYGFEPVANYSEASEFPWLLANVRDEQGDPVPGTEPYTVVERGNVTVGVVGLVDEQIRSKTAVDFDEHGYEVTDYVEAGSRAAETLETEEDVDVVVAAAHIGVPDSKELARNTERIDVIVTGDDEIAYGPTTVDDTVIVEAEARANYLGEANLTVGGGDVTLESGQLHELGDDSPFPVDESTRATIERARSQQLSEVVGRTTVPLDSTFDANYAEETGWGNTIADGMRDRTDAQVALTNAGGIRGDFVVPPGNVTYDDVYTSLPFGNYLVTKRLSGEQLRELLVSQATGLEDGYGAQAQLQVSGVTYEFVDRPDASTTVTDVTVNGAPLDPNATYDVTLNSYMAGWSFEERYGWTMDELATVDRDYTLYGTAAAEYVEANSPITGPTADRIRRVTRTVGNATVDVDGDVATIGVGVPETVSDVNGSTVRVQNATDGVVYATNVTLDDGALEVTVGANELRTLAAASERLQLYGAYSDAKLDERRNGFERSVLNGNVPFDAEPTPSETTVGVGDATVPHGATAEVPVRAVAVPNGLAGGSVTLSVENGEVATIAGATYADDLGITARPEIGEDGTTVALRAADLTDAIRPGDENVTIATVELRGTGTGSTELTVTTDAMDDDAGDDLDVDTRAGEFYSGPPPIGDDAGAAAPTDGDGDRRYEDVNGNGRLDYHDVVVLFEHLESDAVGERVDAYDFNENGRVDYDDVVTLAAAL